MIPEFQKTNWGTPLLSGWPTPSRKPVRARLLRSMANVERLGHMFQWGHMAEDAYRAERQRLTALRAELLATQAAAVDTTALPLGSLMEGWRADDPRTRRDLCRSSSMNLTVLDGRIIEWVPRKDMAALVATLLENAFGN